MPEGTQMRKKILHLGNLTKIEMARTWYGKRMGKTEVLEEDKTY